LAEITTSFAKRTGIGASRDAKRTGTDILCSMSVRNWLSLLSLVVVVGCGSRAQPVLETWPDQEWSRGAPETQGFDSDQLASLVDDIAKSGLGVHSLTVVRRGVLVLNAHFFPWDGARRHDIASCTKSLTGTGIGLAQARGYLPSLDAPLLSFFPGRSDESDPRKRAITLANALEMRTGISCASTPFEATLLELLKSPDFVDFSLSLPMATDPGAHWNYCSPVSHVLSAVVTRATERSLDDWLREQLFEPLGVTAVDAPRDAQGVTHGWGDMRMAPLDLARVGLLFQRSGRWRDRQLLPESWIDEATRSHGDGYGYHWWSDGDAFSARGRGGQYLYVHPGLELVIVTTGSMGPEGEPRLGELLNTRLLPALRDPSGLPANPPAEARYRNSVDAAANPPAQKTPESVPAIIESAAGQRFALAENALGWEGIELGFSGETATLTLMSGGTTSQLAFGMDGVARTSSARRFTLRPEVDVALVGHFQSERTLELDFDTLADIDAGSLTLTFDPSANTVTVDVFERTFLHDHLIIEGTRAN
jgi:CubicO group peptidase (beta-lactamase class C family)